MSKDSPYIERSPNMHADSGPTKSIALQRILALNPIARALFFCLIWLVIWRAAVLMEYAPHASIWFPPAGLSFAAFLVVGWRATPLVLLCAVISTFWVDHIYQDGVSTQSLWISGLLFGVAHCCAYGIGSWLLKFLNHDREHHSIPRLIISFLVFGSLSALIAAVLGSYALAIGGTIAVSDVVTLWLPWWIGDMAGVTVLAPFFVGALSYFYPDSALWLRSFRSLGQSSRRRMFYLKLMLSLLVLTVLMALAAYFDTPEMAFAVFFLIIPQMWLVYTETPFRAVISVAAFSVVTAVLVRTLDLFEHAIVYQFAVNVVAASAYFGLAVPVLIADNRQLRKMATTDSLTQLMNRQTLVEQSTQEMLRADRYALPISMIVFDIDFFKGINDQFGHSVGDSTLREVANCASDVLRDLDLIGRFGGDEFVVLLINTDLDEALGTAHRIREALMEIKVGSGEQVSGSFGVAQMRASESFDFLFERADLALLDAKRDGRNRVAQR